MTDMRMPGFDGLKLQEELNKTLPHLSLVFITGHGNIPMSVRAIKAFVRSTQGMSPSAAQGMRLPALVTALESEDALEGVLAFKEHRKPVWRGL